MKKQETIAIYEQRIEAAIEHIGLHLDEELTLAGIAAVAHFSPFHFHRIFKAFRGEPLGVYITRKRVEAAAGLLRDSDKSIESIAYSVGFNVPASLNKAFRQYYGTTPTKYRNTNTLHIMKTQKINQSVRLETPKIVELEPQTVIFISLRGEYAGLDFPGTFAKLREQAKAQNLFTADMEHLAIYLDDPRSTDPAKLRTDICLVVHKPAVPAGEVQVKSISGGRYAVFTHTGAYSEVGAVYDAIYGEWVPANCTCGDDCQCGDNCKCALRDEPVFEKYGNAPADTAPENLQTEIYIPIK